MNERHSDCQHKPCHQHRPTRRDFVRTTAAGAVTMLLADVFPGRVFAADASRSVQVMSYPRQAIAELADVQPHNPLPFEYPVRALHTRCVLIQLGTPAGGGVGPGQDIVAFNGYCTHMGGDVSDGYVPAHRLLGCSEHLTTFDLTRHGMVIAGHATAPLPQILLEVEAGEIYATGIVGLFYGYSDNPLPRHEAETQP